MPEAAGATALDRNTGLPVALQGLGFSQDQATVSSGRTDTSTTTQAERTRAATVQSVNMLNTTPTALAALDTLIGQLSTRSAVSDAELNSKFPLATPVYSREGGWMYQNPVTKGTMSSQEAQQFNAQQEVKRQQVVTQAGTIGPTLSPQTQGRLADRDLEIQRNRTQQGEYSKAAAFTDAQALMDKALQDALERELPQITAASEGAGTSKGSMRALLTQRAAERGATEGAALGSQLSTAYGGLSNQLASTLELLTRSDPNSPEAMLLQAILGSKGLVQQGTTGQTTVSEGSKSGTTVGTQGPSAQVVATDRKPIAPTPVNFNPPAPASQQKPVQPFYAIAAGNPDATSFAEGNSYLSLFNRSADELYTENEEI